MVSKGIFLLEIREGWSRSHLSSVSGKNNCQVNCCLALSFGRSLSHVNHGFEYLVESVVSLKEGIDQHLKF